MTEDIRPKAWLGPVPKVCDLCAEPLVEVFYDAQVRGRWGCFCQLCQDQLQRPLGPGKGQRYEYDPTSGRWPKTAGLAHEAALVALATVSILVVLFDLFLWRA